MPGVGGDTLRDVHRSGRSQVRPRLGNRRSARLIIGHTCSVRKSTPGIGRVETVGAASAPLQPRSARKCCDRWPRVKISTREDQLERDLPGKVSRPPESARKRTGNRTVRSACRARRQNLPCLSGRIAAGGRRSQDRGDSSSQPADTTRIDPIAKVVMPRREVGRSGGSSAGRGLGR
jgi:hypothetical protein